MWKLQRAHLLGVCHHLGLPGRLGICRIRRSLGASPLLLLPAGLLEGGLLRRVGGLPCCIRMQLLQHRHAQVLRVAEDGLGEPLHQLALVPPP